MARAHEARARATAPPVACSCAATATEQQIAESDDAHPRCSAAARLELRAQRRNLMTAKEHSKRLRSAPVLRRRRAPRAAPPPHDCSAEPELARHCCNRALQASEKCTRPMTPLCASICAATTCEQEKKKGKKIRRCAPALHRRRAPPVARAAPQSPLACRAASRLSGSR